MVGVSSGSTIRPISKPSLEPSELTASAVLMWALGPLVQHDLDQHVDWFNSYKVRYQREKALPSGADRNTIYYHPQRWGGIPLLQQFNDNMEHAQELYHQASADAGLLWVDAEMDSICTTASRELGIQVPFKSWQGLDMVVPQIIRGVETALAEDAEQ
jgi:hypothetical protein